MASAHESAVQLPSAPPPQITLSPSIMRCASPTNAMRHPTSPKLPLLTPLSPSRRFINAASPRNGGCSTTSTVSSLEASPAYSATPSSSPRQPYVRNRRTAVSSEPLEDVKNWAPPVYPKTAEESERLKSIVHHKLNLLVQSKSPENEHKIVRAMFKIPVPIGKELIRQGDEGDNFYIVDSGTFDIFVTRPGATVAQLVLQVGPGGSFGELALMYNAPRAATVRATSDAIVWGLDRKSFRQLLVKECVMKKQKHENLLNKVTIFKCLTKLELVQLSEILQVQRVEAGETVIKQGTRGDRFYIVESGDLICKMRAEEHGREVEVMKYGTGGFFGELALISDFGVRKASVIAATPCVLLWIGKTTFDRVLGPIIDTLRRNAHKYPSYAELVARSERRRGQ